MNINIPTSNSIYFFQLLRLLSIFRPFSKLARRDQQVYAVLLHKASQLGIDDIDKINNYLFSSKVRKEMTSEIDISAAAFSNSLTKMRKIGLLNENGLEGQYLFKRDNKLNINFINTV